MEKERLRGHAHFVHEKEKWAIQTESEKDTLRAQWMEDKNRLSREMEAMKIHWQNAFAQEQASHQRALQTLEQNQSQQVNSSRPVL